MTTENTIREFKFDSETEKYHRAEWMTDDQWQCWLFMSALFGGFHNIDNKPKPFGDGIELNTSLGCWSTFDSSALTRAVFLSHDTAIRFEIGPSGPGMLKLCAWKRHTREGRMFERHPDINEALDRWWACK